MVAPVMVRSTTGPDSALFNSFGIDPAEHHEYVLDDPVLIVSHNFTYYAPEEIMAVPLDRPTVVTFGTQQADQVRTRSHHIHLVFPDKVQDRLQDRVYRTVEKSVNVAPMHGAILFRDHTLFYKHLGEQPTVLAQRIMASRIITKPGATLPICPGQTIGFGATTDAFGGPLWWYYFRVGSLRQIKKQLAARRI